MTPADKEALAALGAAGTVVSTLPPVVPPNGRTSWEAVFLCSDLLAPWERAPVSGSVMTLNPGSSVR